MQQAMIKGLVAAQIAETLADYPLADQPLTNHDAREDPSPGYGYEIMDDRQFWLELFRDPRQARRKWTLYEVAVSEWVARIPGLFWTPASNAMRQVSPSLVEHKTREWIRYRPLGKSQRVVGGVGTLRFPRAPDGARLCTLTTTLNVSAGIPALITDAVWEKYNLSEGSVIRCTATWREMDEYWSREFPIVRGIPRGYFVLDDSADIEVRDDNAPIQVHPFSVMEYWNGSTQWLDYVYATADTSDRDYRSSIEIFFEEYRRADGREGKYLLASDVYEPMWDAWFSSPQEMRNARESELRLIEARVDEALNGGDVIEAAAKELASLPHITITDLRRISADAQIDLRRWVKEGGTIAEQTSRLVGEAVQSGKLHALLQLVLAERGSHGLE